MAHIENNTLSKITTQAALTGTYGQGNPCTDVLPDCSEYTKSACQAPYESWGRKNCARFCGFCTPDCADELPDCAAYGQSACVAPYDTWARKNCAKTCKYCGDITIAPPVTSTAAAPKTDCLYRGTTYKLGDVWQDGCQYNCTCGAGRAYRCSTICPTFINTTANCHYQAIDGECCRRLVCSDSPNTPVLSDTGCIYNRTKYLEGQSWSDGCSINCTCVNGRTGQYKCEDTCAPITPNDGCVVVKRNGSCCPQSVCNLPKAGETQAAGCRFNGLVYSEGDEWNDGSIIHTCYGTCRDQIPDCAEYTKTACQAPYDTWARTNCPLFCGFCSANPITTSEVPTTTTTEASLTVKGCVYKGQQHAVGETWLDGCDYRCTCAGPGLTQCTQPCAQYSNLPSNCREETIPGECCKQITCAVNGTLSAPDISLDKGCLYKNKTYAKGQTWMDGCDYRCTCERNDIVQCITP
uniref:Kielin/chordin-like protein n=1 Tax=Magallana gigas TaxID=29159 RepID=K1S478_MAGGI